MQTSLIPEGPSTPSSTVRSDSATERLKWIGGGQSTRGGAAEASEEMRCSTWNSQRTTYDNIFPFFLGKCLSAVIEHGPFLQTGFSSQETED